MMNQDDRRVRSPGNELGANLAGMANGFLTYLKTRSPENWLFFAAGIIGGLMIS